MEGNLRRMSGTSYAAAVRAPDAPAAQLRLAAQFALGALLLLLVALPAQAATYRYSAASNRIYVEGGGVATLTAIKAEVPDAPLELIDPENKIWLLRANLLVEDGSILELHGTPVGGDVDILRLQSNNTPDIGAYVSITADYGTLDLDTVKVTAWNTIDAAADTEYQTFGRAFLRARSELAPDGTTPLESTMDIANSEITNLGFDAAESTGLSWKVNGTDPELYNKVQVRGSVVNSRIARCFTGLYFNGLQEGNIVGNEISNHVGYGIDAHDHTDHTLFEDNYVHSNGNHGILISKYVDHAIIRGNRVIGNAANGIMLHRASRLSLVVDNSVNDNADAGISLFATVLNEIRGNRIMRNANAGIRMAVGANENQVAGNEIAFGGRYGIYLYRGSDVPEPGDNGRNKLNVFSNNNVHDNGAEGLKVADSDKNTFKKNKFRDNASTNLPITTSRATVMLSNVLPITTTMRLIGSPDVTTAVTVKGQKTTSLVMDGYSTARFENAANAVFDVTQAVNTTATPAKTFMVLSTAVLGVSATTVNQRKMYVTPATGTVKVDPTLYETAGSFGKQWRAQSSDAAAEVVYKMGDLAPDTVYGIYKGSAKIGETTSNSTGFATFSIVPDSTTELTYRLGAP